ncbi:MAG: NAD+ synthase [Candidatus Omnitrophica bacterium]|nr:NAD+ synthase [Candidatus Omnitrophota bacterium]
MVVRIALAQINTTVGDLAGNRDKVLDFVRRAKNAGADLVACPELAVTGYPPEDLLLKEHFVDNNIKILREIARQVKGVIAVVGFVDRGKRGEYFNAAAVLANGCIAGIYRKCDLPNYSVFDEKRYFKTGNDPLIFTARGVCFAVNVCEDIWVDQGIYAAQAKKGARLIINISSSPYELGKRGKRLALLKKRARATGAAIGYVNCVGGQDELVFDGASMVVSSQGKLLASGRQFEEDLVICDVPTPPLKKTPKSAVCISSAVRVKDGIVQPSQFAPELSPVEEIYRAIVLGTRDYVCKNGFKKVLIGLSGGIDSSLVAAVACDAVGRENVVGISMPTRYNAEETKNDARLLAQNLGVAFHEVPIEGVFQSYLDLLQPKFQGQAPGLAEENLQSRIRGNILMAFSNKFGWLVLTTGNKSEMATGYCTLYGDMSGGYAVIKDILKTRVYALAEFYNAKEGREVIPQTVFARAPSAELRFDQKDQDSLPPYAVLDELLVSYVEQHGSFKDMAAKAGDAALAKRVIALVDKSEYKRRQAPPGVKITTRAFGKDWRLPLTNLYKAF